MTSKPKNLAIGGALLAGSALAVLFLVKTGKRAQNRKRMILILKDIKREMFSVLYEIATLSKQIRLELGDQVAINDIKQLLFHQSNLSFPNKTLSFFRKINISKIKSEE